MMKKIGLYTCFLLFMALGYVSAQQTHVVPFVRKSGTLSAKFTTMNILRLYHESEYDRLKGIPTVNPVYSIYFVRVNNFPNKQFQTAGVDEKTDNISDRKQKIYMYVGLNEERTEKYVIVDCNHNLDLGDEKLHTFSLKDYAIPSFTEEQYALCQPIKVEIPSTDCPDCCVDLIIHPFYSDKSKDKYDSEDQYLLDIGILTDFYQQGILDIGGKRVYINENKKTDSCLPCPYEPINESSFYHFYQPEDTISLCYSLGDTLSVADRKIHIRAFDNNQLYIDEIGATLDSSRVGSYLPDLYSTDLSDSATVHLNRLMKDKYVFIDFWGSWCGPCIASLPTLKDFYHKVKDRDDVLVLGIALEHKKDVDKLRQIVKENGVEWTNVWNNFLTRKSSSSVHGKLLVESFPTYMIVDKNGKIIYRDTSMFKTQEAVGRFMKLIGY